MSEVAGRMAALNGAYYLQRTKGGKGKMMMGVPGVKPAKVLVLGGGTVGEASARIAAGMGADVIITDISLPRLKQLSVEMPANVHTLYSSEHNIKNELRDTDVVIGSVLVPGDAAPKLITRDMLKLMQPGSVLVDVAIDQGGCFETSHPTTHSEPTYMVDGILHYAVANIPSGAQHIYIRSYKRHSSLCRIACRQGLGTGLPGRRGTEERREHGIRQDYV